MMTRRDVFVATLAAGATSAVLLTPWRHLGQLVSSPIAQTGLGPAFDTVLAKLDSTRHIGRSFIESTPKAPTSQTLISRLGKRLGSDLNSQADVEAAITAAVKADFSAARTCPLDGWLLSQTECELAGLRWQLYGDASARSSATAPDKAPTSASASTATAALIAEVTNWGPQSTEQGSKFNVQPDGHSGLWFVAEDVPSWAKVLIDGIQAPTTVSESGFTSGLFGEMQERILSTPGIYTIELHDPMRDITQHIGDLEVRPLAERALLPDGTRSQVFCPVSNWGPDQTTVGVPANAQPDGSQGMWFALPCAPPRVQVVFGDDRLTATRTESGVTCRVPLALLESARRVALKLRDVDTGEELEVGQFDILER